MKPRPLGADSTLEGARKALKALAGSRFAVRSAARLLRERKGKIVVTGVGKSSFIGQKLAATLTSLGEYASFLNAVDALHGDSGMVGRGDVLIAISFSGETPEVLRVVRHLTRLYPLPVVGLVGNARSSLGKLADIVVAVKVKDEGSPLNLAPMASTTASLVAGDMLASELVAGRNFRERHFAQYHPAGSLGLKVVAVAEILRPLPAVRLSASLKEAAQAITKYKKGVVGVLGSSGALAGVITDGDLRRFLSVHESILGRKAREAMSKRPKTVSRTASLYDALTLMERYKITSLFVLGENHKPAGIVHMHDIIERSTQ